MKRILIIMLSALMTWSCQSPQQAEKAGCAPDIFPDYTGVTVPRTIAPLNFEVKDAEKVYVTATCGEETIIAKGHSAVFKPGSWKKLLAGGNTVTVNAKALTADGWKEFDDFNIYICDDPIDESVVYRRIDPGYEFYGKMGIWQRDLSSFKEKTVFENIKSAPGCVNCHSFAQCDPSSAQIHFRGKNGGTLIIKGDSEKVLNMSNDKTLGTVYPYWHPSGRYVAYSVNDIKQSFHNEPSRVLEVYDLKSDVVVFDTETDQLLVYPALQDSMKFETFPSFSPDGKTLYFCSADATDDFMNVRYSLCSVSFNPEDGTIGDKIATIWSSEDKSASFPRPSYDGKNIMFTVSDFGNFSIWHEEADLWILDTDTLEARPIDEINSSDTESYHSWSSNSAWVVFSSRRIDGRHTRLFFSHRNSDGTFSKPFQLPQRNPHDDILLLQSSNIPEFCNGIFTINKDKVYDEQRTPIKVINK